MKKQYLFIFFILFTYSINAQNPATFTIHTDKPIANVAPTMWGIFFEDINLGADGGLYAELIKNRSFEFAKPLMGWKKLQSQAAAALNPYYDYIQSNFFIINSKHQTQFVIQKRKIGTKLKFT